MMLIAVLLLTLSVNSAQAPDAAPRPNGLLRSRRPRRGAEALPGARGGQPRRRRGATLDRSSAPAAWVSPTGPPRSSSRSWRRTAQNIDALVGSRPGADRAGRIRGGRARRSTAPRRLRRTASTCSRRRGGSTPPTIATASRSPTTDARSRPNRGMRRSGLKPDALRAARAHRVDLGYDFQAFDPSAGVLHAGTSSSTRASAIRCGCSGADKCCADAGVRWTDLARFIALGLIPRRG